MSEERTWVALELPDIDVGRVTTVVAGGRALCITRTQDGWGVLDNRCPHQGGPLGDGQLEGSYVICPWHAYEYDPTTGRPPSGFADAAVAYPTRRTATGDLEVGLPTTVERPSLMDQVVDVLTDWGLDAVFGMVGHSNLGLADALRRASEDGRLSYVGIRHEGAAAFAASGYAKLTGRPAACFSIAGPGATNLLTGLWDAKVDRAPVVALTGQVQTQVVGPGAFQEVPLDKAFGSVAAFGQPVLSPGNATELAALAMKHAIVERDVAHLIFPDEVQELPGRDDPPPKPMQGRIAAPEIAPPQPELGRAIELLAEAWWEAAVASARTREAQRVRTPYAASSDADGDAVRARPSRAERRVTSAALAVTLFKGLVALLGRPSLHRGPPVASSSHGKARSGSRGSLDDTEGV